MSAQTNNPQQKQIDPLSQETWHLDKTINISHILTTVTIAVSVFVWASSLEKRIETTSQSVRFISERQKDDKDEVRVLRSEIRQDLNQINDKLDRLIESGKK